jgi:hypothetical protein
VVEDKNFHIFLKQKSKREYNADTRQNKMFAMCGGKCKILPNIRYFSAPKMEVIRDSVVPWRAKSPARPSGGTKRPRPRTLCARRRAARRPEGRAERERSGTIKHQQENDWNDNFVHQFREKIGNTSLILESSYTVA